MEGASGDETLADLSGIAFAFGFGKPTRAERWFKYPRDYPLGLFHVVLSWPPEEGWGQLSWAATFEEVFGDDVEVPIRLPPPVDLPRGSTFVLLVNRQGAFEEPPPSADDGVIILVGVSQTVAAVLYWPMRTWAIVDGKSWPP